MRLFAAFSLGILLAFTAIATRAESPTDEGGVPEGVDMLMDRGGIPAVFDPVFVPATEAEIPDDAWVLGVFIDGVAKAYSLNLLNHHEVVNDQIGDHPFAAVW